MKPFSPRFCPGHNDAQIRAEWQLTLYERQAAPHPPFPKWRGFACEECLEGARTLLKKSGGGTILLIWRLK